jgi:hypothetical protein
MNNTIYSFWIAGVLKPINHLTIRSFQNHGHKFVIYAYEPFGLTGDCEVRDAREILPESEIFYYKNMLGGNPNFKFGGIAERLKAEMLYQLGGWHVDLDVTCLKSFHDLTGDYFLRPHEKGVVGNIIKAPKGSELARRYVEHTKTIDENNRIWEKSFMGLNKIVTDLGLEKYILPKEVLGDDSSEYWEKFLKAGNVPDPELHAIHHCGAMAAYEKYEKGSYFEKLLLQYNLI